MWLFSTGKINKLAVFKIQYWLEMWPPCRLDRAYRVRWWLLEQNWGHLQKALLLHHFPPGPCPQVWSWYFHFESKKAGAFDQKSPNFHKSLIYQKSAIFQKAPNFHRSPNFKNRQNLKSPNFQKSSNFQNRQNFQIYKFSKLSNCRLDRAYRMRWRLLEQNLQ